MSFDWMLIVPEGGTGHQNFDSDSRDSSHCRNHSRSLSFWLARIAYDIPGYSPEPDLDPLTRRGADTGGQ
jgi:hypothetical protein